MPSADATPVAPERGYTPRKLRCRTRATCRQPCAVARPDAAHWTWTPWCNNTRTERGIHEGLLVHIFYRQGVCRDHTLCFDNRGPLCPAPTSPGAQETP